MELHVHQKTACLLVVWCTFGWTNTSAAYPVCELENVISDDRSLLPLDAITASDAMNDDPAQFVVERDTGGSDRRDSWCSAQDFQDGPMPYIMFTFTERVAMTRMIGRGARAGDAYVTSFALDILNKVSGQFVQYNRTGNIMDFTTSFSIDVPYTFSPPAVGQVFRFRILEGVRNSDNVDFCWNVIFFGCSAPATPQPSTSSPEPPTGTSIITPVSTAGTSLASSSASCVLYSSSTMGAGTPASSDSGGSSSNLAAVVTPSIIGGAVLLLVMAAVLLVLLLVISRRHSRHSVERLKKEVVQSGGDTIRVVNNTLYLDRKFPQKTSDGSSNVYETVVDPVYSNATEKRHSASNQQDTPASSTAADDLEYHYTTPVPGGATPAAGLVADNPLYKLPWGVGPEDSLHGMVDNGMYNCTSPTEDAKTSRSP